jgi:hypothetical protein
LCYGGARVIRHFQDSTGWRKKRTS